MLCSQEPFGALLRYPIFHTAGEELSPPIVQINAVHIGPMGRPNEASNKVALQTEVTLVDSYLAVLKFGVRPLRVVRDQCLSARANFDIDMLHTR